jgi:hypothetical protein
LPSFFGEPIKKEAQVLLIAVLAFGYFTLGQSAPPSAAVTTVPFEIKSHIVNSYGRLELTLHNSGSRDIIAWTIRVDVTRPNGTVRSTYSTEDRFRALALKRAGFSSSGPPTPVFGPGVTLQQGIDFQPDAVAVVPTAVAAMFDDGSIAGEREHIEFLLAKRQAVVQALDDWVPKLQAALAISSAPERSIALRKALTSPISARAKTPEDLDISMFLEQILGGQTDDNLIVVRMQPLMEYLKHLRAEADRASKLPAR